jgi:hypothetical protein
MTPFTDLVPTIFPIHAFQVVNTLYCNRVQGQKLAIMTHASTLGYSLTPTDAHVASILRDCHIFSFMILILSKLPLLEVDYLNAYLKQAADDLQRSVAIPPDLIRSNVLTLSKLPATSASRATLSAL